MKKIIKNVKIVDYSHKGFGICKVDNQVIFVQNALRDEILDIQILEYKKKIAYACITNIVKSSKNRIEPICKDYNECGGCSLLHMNYEEQLYFKQQIATTLIKKNKIKYSEPVIIKANPCEYRYRNKVTFSFFVEGNMLQLGFNKAMSNEFIKIEECFLISQNMNEIKFQINKTLNELKDENLDLYNFEKLIIRENESNEFMIIIQVKTLNKVKNQKVIEAFNKIKEEARGVKKVLFLDKKDSIKIGNEDYYYTLKDKRFKIGPRSFFQVNTEQTINIYDEVKRLISKDSINVLDSYSGVGSIGIYALQEGQRLISVEVVKEAVQMGKENAIFNNIKNFEILCLDLEKNLNTLNEITNFSFDTIIIDPPRKGISKKLINSIYESKVKEIIYISCSLQSLTRDLKYLEQFYNVEYFNLFDMFSQTPHVEALVKLKYK